MISGTCPPEEYRRMAAEKRTAINHSARIFASGLQISSRPASVLVDTTSATINLHERAGYLKLSSS